MVSHSASLHGTEEWQNISWEKVNRHVKSLQARIVKAVRLLEELQRTAVNEPQELTKYYGTILNKSKALLDYSRLKATNRSLSGELKYQKGMEKYDH